ncbi:MAG: pyruvate/oxaloacetate carboxyltransferase [Dehalococcoidia bacterium]|nr:pyruvate/oxaloacetate carboxyltransferase [Dehalococcoidia bacterium]
MGIKITDTTLRDAHQSLIATRMRSRDMLPMVEKMDKAGFFSLEMWGGATFDTSIRYLNEDPWDRLRDIRSRAKHTHLQMLLRGQNLVGYRHYSDDVVREFIRLAAKNGVDVFRIFDALNDIRNMELSIAECKKHKVHVQGTICYTISPVHTTEGFAEMAHQLENLGCDSVCIKDMAGLISPPEATSVVKAIKSRVKIPVDLHSHCSSGMAPMSYQAAAEAGADILDTAFSPFAWGTSQPPTESVVAAFKDTPYDCGIDLELLYEIGEDFAQMAGKYRPLLTSEATRPSINVLLHQIPGGMLSNLVSQLREQNALDKIGAVFEEVPRVRADLGYPPLVTPTSQIVGIQAVLNVLNGERYKKVTKEVKDYLMGLYGRPPGELNEEVRKMVVGDNDTITGRPGEHIKPELAKLKDEAKKLGILHKEEDLVTYALYPQVAVKFLRGEAKEEIIAGPAPESAPSQSGPDVPTAFSVDVDGEIFNIKITPVLGQTFDVEKKSKPKEIPAGAVMAPMQGMVLTVKVKVGDKVKEDDIVVVTEAMKMQSDVHSPFTGTVKEIFAFNGEIVNKDDVLMVIN